MINRAYDVIVVGGGASGMMAAAEASMHGKRVLLLEKNYSLAVKLKISGGGRCNITNAETDTRILLRNYGKAEKLLYAPFSEFGMQDTFTFFTKHGLPLVVEDNKRAFPKSQKAWDVYQTLLNILLENDVTIKTNYVVERIIRNKESIIGIETNHETFVVKSLILATGGVSHPETGSTGDGFTWLKELGHTIHEPTPTIVPLAVKEQWVKSMQGVSLPTMKITFYVDKKKQFSKKGSLLFTHFGVSGPLILNTASKVYTLLQEGDVTAHIDAFPDMEINILERKVLDIFDMYKQRTLKTVFKDIVPSGTSNGLQLLFPDIDFETKVHSVTKEDRKKIVHTLKDLPITITGLMGKDRAVAADGGVELGEIDMKTMRSKLYHNLYITGDLLHINRPSGGYSLQLCWTTGYIAGRNA